MIGTGNKPISGNEALINMIHNNIPADKLIKQK
jgi:hypothetical protein